MIKMEMVYHSTDGDIDLYFVFVDDKIKFSIGVPKGDTKTPYMILDAVRKYLEENEYEPGTI